jgi:signal peptidase I
LPRRILFLAVPIFCLFLVIRTVGVEPYGVPTGSMAPALVGNHRETFCPRCGYRVIVGEPSRDRTDPYPLATCPNCGRDGIDLSASQDIPGDRLLVDKNVFSLRSPRRWEVAVFHCPVDTTTPYVKRVVGLPGEAVQVIGGDVFANGTILRKTLSELREVRVPVFDMNFAPPGGWAVRWLIAPLAANPPQPNSGVTPDGAVVDESVLKDGVLTLDAASAPNAAVGLTYRHWNLDRKTEEPVRDRLAYNDASSNRAKSPVDVHDFLVEFDLEWGAGTGSFAMRLGDGLDSVSAELGSESVKLGPDGGDPGVKPGFHPIPGRTYHLAFAFADRRASLAVDGKEMLPPVDLPADPAALSRRVGVSHPLQFGARGVRVAVKNLILYRDVHYRSDGPNGTRLPYQLGPNEYFMLGDNSANSADSRVWTKPKTGAAAGVPERDFIGKPFLIHQPLRLGRLRVNGRDRTFQTVDWSRVKWVR